MRLLYLLLALLSLPTLAADDPLLLARQYMQAYTAMDYGELEQLYHFDATFEDPSADVQGNGQRINGRQAILAFLKKAERGVGQIRFVENNHMVIGNWVVLMGEYHYLVSGPQFGLGPQPVWVVVKGITELKVDTGLGQIRTHRDMLDYESLPAQLQ
ncbi:nuclear transport factor 2 family protein [Gallaecimonas kandeliae]|uniref:nuclear transport factor 2 family protein n=1 Tax=Gallaecimonas kandeliae TaxID=3029055 RepID=UPI002647A580|nr:nuclear transport factor 2 family protein [Gallaecimonas kandeliae]WKE64835.1 nuclear transport factor 2 family protein [Gallaecimonas kandeliae]